MHDELVYGAAINRISAADTDSPNLCAIKLTFRPESENNSATEFQRQ